MQLPLVQLPPPAEVDAHCLWQRQQSAVVGRRAGGCAAGEAAQIELYQAGRLMLWGQLLGGPVAWKGMVGLPELQQKTIGSFAEWVPHSQSHQVNTSMWHSRVILHVTALGLLARTPNASVVFPR